MGRRKLFKDMVCIPLYMDAKDRDKIELLSMSDGVSRTRWIRKVVLSEVENRLAYLGELKEAAAEEKRVQCEEIEEEKGGQAPRYCIDCGDPNVTVEVEPGTWVCAECESERC